MQIFSSLKKPGDHFHVSKFGGAVGTDITEHHVDEGSVCMESGVLSLFDSEGRAKSEEGEE